MTPQRFVDAINGLDTNADSNPATCGDPNRDPPCNYYWAGAYHGALPGQTYAQTLAKAGININDYISNGHNRKNPNGEIAPRLGFSFDLQGNQHHVIFGGAGRSYDRNVFGILQHESNKATALACHPSASTMTTALLVARQALGHAHLCYVE